MMSECSTRPLSARHGQEVGGRWGEESTIGLLESSVTTFAVFLVCLVAPFYLLSVHGYKLHRVLVYAYWDILTWEENGPKKESPLT